MVQGQEAGFGERDAWVGVGMLSEGEDVHVGGASSKYTACAWAQALHLAGLTHFVVEQHSYSLLPLGVSLLSRTARLS